MDRNSAKILLTHFEVLKAFADGAKVQRRLKATDPKPAGEWVDTENPQWNGYSEYRVKPAPRILYELVNRHRTPVIRSADKLYVERQLEHSSIHGRAGPYSIITYQEILE